MTLPPGPAVLFVCLGNICRSPTAEGVFRHLVAQAGLGDLVHVDSAGILSSTEGEPPDPRTLAAARRRGYDLTALRARPVVDQDFQRFDLILGMDQDNVADLRARCPADRVGRVRLFLSFAAERAEHEVPDPYLGDAEDFEHVLDLIEHGSRALLRHLRAGS